LSELRGILVMPFRASTDPPSGKFVCRSQKAHLAKANQSFSL